MNARTMLCTITLALTALASSACAGSPKAGSLIWTPGPSTVDPDDDSSVLELLALPDGDRSAVAEEGTARSHEPSKTEHDQSEFLEGTDANDADLLQEPAGGSEDTHAESPDDGASPTDVEVEADEPDSPEIQ